LKVNITYKDLKRLPDVRFTGSDHTRNFILTLKKLFLKVKQRHYKLRESLIKQQRNTCNGNTYNVCVIFFTKSIVP